MLLINGNVEPIRSLLHEAALYDPPRMLVVPAYNPRTPSRCTRSAATAYGLSACFHVQDQVLETCLVDSNTPGRQIYNICAEVNRLVGAVACITVGIALAALVQAGVPKTCLRRVPKVKDYVEVQEQHMRGTYSPDSPGRSDHPNAARARASTTLCGSTGDASYRARLPSCK